MRKRTLLGIVAGILVVGGLATAAIAGHHPSGTASTEVAVKRGDLAVVVSETGTVAPKTQTDIKSRVAGLVSTLNVDVGDRVKRGQVLLTLDATDYRRQQAQAEADRAVAAATLAKLVDGPMPQEREEARASVAAAKASLIHLAADYRRTLTPDHATAFTRQQIDQIRSDYEAGKANLEAAEAKLSLILAGSRPEDIAVARGNLQKAEVALEQADDQLSYTTIRSPIDGVVISRGIQIGEAVSPGVSAYGNGTALMTVADLSTLIVKSNLNQIDIGKVRDGMPAEVRVDSDPGAVFQGTVTKVAPAAQATTTDGTTLQTFPIETTLKNADPQILKPGMTADLDIHVTDKKDALYLPVEAVIRGVGTAGTVYLPPKTSGGKPVAHPVTIGLTNDHQVEIVSGLTQGQDVLINPPSAAGNTANF